jgi:single-strand selective monofunctional uracil DNA glycosylase
MKHSLSEITDELVTALEPLEFGPPTAYVYNPLIYARKAWDLYCERYGQGSREVLVVGMNPGPFGMAQVGVPFGEVSAVRDWLGIETPIGRPPREHPKRPVEGFACRRSEVSGARLWGWARERFGTPERFFSRFFLTNYCPLVFMEDSGRNRIPEKLPREEREILFAVCDRALLQTVAAFEPKFVVGVGTFAAARAKFVLAGRRDVIVGSIPHPSPASPQANRGWGPLADQALAKLGIEAKDGGGGGTRGLMD